MPSAASSGLHDRVPVASISIMSMKQLASSEKLGRIEKDAFFGSWGALIFGLKLVL